MPKKRTSNKFTKRPLDLNGIKEGQYATIAQMSVPSSGYPVTFEALSQKLQQMAKDLRNALPNRAPVSFVVDWKSEICFRAVVMTVPEGALPTDGVVHLSAKLDPKQLANTSQAEAEQIATSIGIVSKAGIDVGNSMASEAEKRVIPLDNAIKTIQTSPDSRISRTTYARARGAEAHIYYSDGERALGGNKVIPATTHSTETFELQQCHLKKVKKSEAFEFNCSLPHEDWRRLHAHTPGICFVKGEADSPIQKCLLVAANAGIRVDMTVCISEKIATGERWCTPISIKNKSELFAQGHEWLAFLEESLET